MVVIRFKGGLGNQLFQYAAARALAERHGVPLRYDASWFSDPAHHRAVTRTFDLPAFRTTGMPATERELAPFHYPPRSSRAGRLVQRIARSLRNRKLWIDDRAGYLPAVEQLPARTMLEGYFQHPRYFASIAPALKADLQYGGVLPSAVQELAAELAACESVCIQIRRTDFVADPATAAVHGSCGLGYFEQAWRLIGERVGGARGFVFSDDYAWAREAFATWSDVRVLGREWDGPAFLHQFHLMSSCRHFVIANSTWGWWAAWRGQWPGRVVVMPRRWYAAPEANAAAEGLRLPDWNVV